MWLGVKLCLIITMIILGWVGKQKYFDDLAIVFYWDMFIVTIWGILFPAIQVVRGNNKAKECNKKIKSLTQPAQSITSYRYFWVCFLIYWLLFLIDLITLGIMHYLSSENWFINQGYLLFMLLDIAFLGISILIFKKTIIEGAARFWDKRRRNTFHGKIKSNTKTTIFINVALNGNCVNLC